MYVYYCREKTKKKVKRRIIVLFLALFAFLSCIFLYIRNVVNPVIVVYAESKINVMTIIAVNNAIMKVFETGVSYGDIISIQKDGGGNIVMLLANSEKISAIARNTARQSQEELDKMGEQSFSLALGSLTGAPLLTGLGPQISIKILPESSVVCRFKSVFESAGINQTLHKIFIEVCAYSDVVLPLSSQEFKSTVEILITEAVLIGKIPDTYVQFDASGVLNLLPD